MAIPTYDQVMLPLLKFIKNGNVYNNKQCIEGLSKYFNLTEDEMNQRLSSNKKIFYDRVNWAKTYLSKAKLIESISRGKFKITKDGSALLKENVEYIDAKFLLKYDCFKDYFYKGRDTSKNKDDKDVSTEVVPVQDKTPLENLENTLKEIKESLIDEVLEKVKEIDFFYFEEIVLDLLIKMGYGGSRESAKRATKKTGDEGIDGIINEDRLGLDRIYVQAKRWKDTVVGSTKIREFSGALDPTGVTKGVFITTSTFTEGATKYAEQLSSKKIVLIDGKQLAEYMIDFNVGVSVESTFEIKKIDMDYFIEE